MGLVFHSIYIIIIVICNSDGDDCTRWDKNANNTIPPDVVEDLIENIREYIPVVTTDRNIFDIESAIEDYNRGLQNEDVHWNITQLIKKNGYPVEEHKVTTSDGYILAMFRIPGNGPVLFIMHGLLSSSDDFVTPGEGRALAYVLAAAGYDIWLGNARGNVHSRQNINLSPDCKEFWDFSYDDIGRKDLPKMIDYVLEKTNQTNLRYIGHSQGTTSFFVMCSEMPEYNEKISMMIALAPVAWISHTTNILVVLPNLFIQNPYSESLFELIFGYEIIPRNEVINAITDIACSTPETATLFCENIYSLFFGFDYGQLNATYLPRVFAHVPAGCSLKQLLHYGQGILYKKFRQYDYGVLENLKIYGSTSPPDYPVRKISTRVVLFCADSDNFVQKEDVSTLVENLPNFNMSNFYRIPYKPFHHSDFLFANDVKVLVYDKILEFLSQNQNP